MATKEQMLKEAQDVKDAAKAEAAYNAAMTNTPAAPKPMPKPKKMAHGGSVSMDKSKDKAMIAKAFKQHDTQKHKGSKGTALNLKSGGSVSSRADGIATKGKTKGTMITMRNGGMC
jgi:hypothetical protein